METRDLIRQLTVESSAVQRLRPPLLRAVMWTAVAMLVLAAVTTTIGVRPDLAAKLREWPFVVEVISAAATGVIAAIAAFHLSLPDRSTRWTLLPLPTLLVWLSTVGYGCLSNWVALGPSGPIPGLSLPCLAVIVFGSTPLAVGLFFMLRHARFVRPVETGGVAALAVAGLTVSALRLFHELDATVMVLIWNVGATGIILGVGFLFGRRLSGVSR